MIFDVGEIIVLAGDITIFLLLKSPFVSQVKTHHEDPCFVAGRSNL